jgi:pimeloyl-ACP methyl ester carboxylesterase
MIPILLGALAVILSHSPPARLHVVDPGLHLVDRGTGPPVVLVPGAVGGVYAFRRLSAALLEAGRRVIVVEPLGMGRSPHPKDADYSLGAQGRRIADVVTQLKLERPVLVGHALGASIALRAACLKGDQVAAVIMLDGGSDSSAASPGIRKVAGLGMMADMLFRGGAIRRQVQDGLYGDAGDTTWINPDVVDGYAADLLNDSRAVLDAWRGMAKAKEAAPLATALQGCRVPARLLVGTKPRGKGQVGTNATELASWLPSFTVDSLIGVGRSPQEEKLPEVVAAVLRVSEQPK